MIEALRVVITVQGSFEELETQASSFSDPTEIHLLNKIDWGIHDAFGDVKAELEA
jgi:hypothetical protein